MENQTAKPEWMQDELVRSIAPEKLDFLQQLFEQNHGRSQKEIMRSLMPLMKKAKQEHLTFTTAEMNAAIKAIKKYSTKEELTQIDKILSQTGKNSQMGK